MGTNLAAVIGCVRTIRFHRSALDASQVLIGGDLLQSLLHLTATSLRNVIHVRALSDNGMPGLKAESSYQGCLWTRAGSPVWQSVFARLQHDQTLLVFTDETAANSGGSPTQTVDIRNAQVSEFSLHSGGRHMFERALRVSGGHEQTAQSGFSSPPAEHIFAAQDGVSHSQWLRKFCINSAAACGP